MTRIDLAPGTFVGRSPDRVGSTLRPSLGLAVGEDEPISSELAAAVEASARELGVTVDRVAGPAAASERDVVLAIGYPDHYPWLSQRLPATRRIAWLGEPLPPAGEPAVARLRRTLPMGRILDAISPAARLGGRRTLSTRLVLGRERAAIDHDWRHNVAVHRRAAANGIGLVVTSRDRADSLRRIGVSSHVVPFGYHPIHAGPAQPVDDTDRDIDVLVLATEAVGGPTRRARILDEILRELGPGYRVEVIERGVFGAERHRRLGRARVVLNVHRVPGNFTGIRTVMVGAAGALLVSEPVDTPEPFVPGVHYIEARSDALAATVRSVLADRAGRLEMAATLQTFLVERLTMANSLEMVLEATS